jgi:hypothetical protein
VDNDADERALPESQVAKPREGSATPVNEDARWRGTPQGERVGSAESAEQAREDAARRQDRDNDLKRPQQDKDKKVELKKNKDKKDKKKDKDKDEQRADDQKK